MIDLLGARRLIVLFLLLGLNALLATVVHGYLEPQQRIAEQDVRIVRSRIFELQSDIEKMQVEYTQLQEQQEQYEALVKKGFFEFQGRREAQDLFEDLQRRANVIKATANIGAGKLTENEMAEKASHELLVSPVDIKITAYDDIDVYKYLYLLRQSFPGHVSIDKLSLRRAADLDSIVLRGIAGGEDVGLISADVNFTWRTMVPKDNQEIYEEGGER